MKLTSITLFAYSLYLLAGGLAAYLFSSSVVSLAMSSLFAVLLLTSGFALLKQYKAGYYVALGSLSFLLLFFGYRFFITQNFMPSGLSGIITLVVLLILLLSTGKSNMVKRNSDISR